MSENFFNLIPVWHSHVYVLKFCVHTKWMAPRFKLKLLQSKTIMVKFIYYKMNFSILVKLWINVNDMRPLLRKIWFIVVLFSSIIMRNALIIYYLLHYMIIYRMVEVMSIPSFTLDSFHSIDTWIVFLLIEITN